ncbi:hypothetical protein PCASD_01725 [Puccinia coronata f. sp. avenae]|uniref:CxC1-like cysteine cluster associated with KDZ transposases domain-containing protein n=1 Tax=Puccinia coronata f. sp. avenae TaxID=200324 RepID=A0A2N5VJX5_9BASI|nr:hypothetical protein PCASD_01725 [Puccinia coronata f. sp. avenae]
MRLLAYHNYAWHHSNVRTLPFVETQKVFAKERSEVLWNQSKSAGRNLQKCFSKAVLLYRKLLGKTRDVVHTTLGLNNSTKLASKFCPACFAPSMKTGSHQVNPATWMK